MAANRRVTVGFRGGGALGLRLSEDALRDLSAALGSGGWHEVQGEDGTARMNLDQVVYVQVETAEGRVGFGA